MEQEKEGREDGERSLDGSLTSIHSRSFSYVGRIRSLLRLRLMDRRLGLSRSGRHHLASSRVGFLDFVRKSPRRKRPMEGLSRWAAPHALR
jgi:hypothetical protein